MTFNELFFHKFESNVSLYNKLKKNFFNSSLSHSTLVYGEKGIGKSTFIKMLIYEFFNNFADANKSIAHKTLTENSVHPNFFIISKLFDEKIKKFKNYILIDQIRDLESYIYKSSINNLPKFILIDSADDLNINSSNALLKILEEPKKDTFFFLISHQLSKLLPTIKSRCIKFKFNKPTFEEFDIIIRNDFNDIEEDKVKYLYDLSNGSPEIALNLNTDETYDIFDKFFDICMENKILSNNILNFSSDVKNFNNEQYSNFLLMVKFMLSNVIKIKLGIDIKKQLSLKLSNKLKNFSKYIFSSSCLKALDYINENENDLYTYNLDKKFFTINLFSEIVKN